MKAIGLGLITYVMTLLALSFVIGIILGISESRKKVDKSLSASVNWVSFLVGLAITLINW